MALIPWSETHPLTDFRTDIDSIFDRFFGIVLPSEKAFWGDAFIGSPAVDIEETDKEVIVKADLPGLDPKDVDISVTENILTIKGEKREERKEEKKNFHLSERRYGSFARSFLLPAEVKTDTVEANYSKGVLEIKLPKAEPEKAKKITVNVK